MKLPRVFYSKYHSEKHNKDSLLWYVILKEILISNWRLVYHWILYQRNKNLNHYNPAQSLISLKICLLWGISLIFLWTYSFVSESLVAIHIRYQEDQRVEAEKTAHPCYCLTWSAVILFIIPFHGWNENLFYAN